MAISECQALTFDAMHKVHDTKAHFRAICAIELFRCISSFFMMPTVARYYLALIKNIVEVSTRKPSSSGRATQDILVFRSAHQKHISILIRSKPRTFSQKAGNLSKTSLNTYSYDKRSSIFVRGQLGLHRDIIDVQRSQQYSGSYKPNTTSKTTSNFTRTS